MPDAQVGKHHRIGHLQLGAVGIAARVHVFIGQHQQEVAQILRCPAQPVLEAEHERAGILRLLHRQVLEHRWQGVQELEHRVLEAGGGAALLLALLHELGDGALALAELGHREGAQLVEPHHLGHRGEHHHRLEMVAVGRHRLHHLLGEVFDEDQRGDEHIGRGHIGAEVGVVLRVAELLDQIAAQLDRQGAVVGVDRLGRRGEGVLVLGLQHHVHRLHHGPSIGGRRGGRADPAVDGADLREHASQRLSNVKEPTQRRWPVRQQQSRRYRRGGGATALRP